MMSPNLFAHASITCPSLLTTFAWLDKSQLHSPSREIGETKPLQDPGENSDFQEILS
jgi:hypothetical protein